MFYARSHFSFIIMLSLFIFCLNFVVIHSTYRSLHAANCSLDFRVQTESNSNKIQTDFPITLIGNYKFLCHLDSLIAYYKIKPLSILIAGEYSSKYNKIKSMVPLETAQFRFTINQSSTISLCFVSINDNDDDIYQDHEHRFCRTIHIGINQIYRFWNSPLAVVYVCLITSLTIYYFIRIVNHWCELALQPPRRRRPRPIPVQRRPVLRRTDTFENEKIRQSYSDEE